MIPVSRPQWQRAALATVVVILTVISGAAVDGKGKRPRARMDARMRAALAMQRPAEQRVIVRVRGDAQAGIKRLLRTRGSKVHADHASIRAFSATVQGADLAALAETEGVEGLSLDAVVRSTAKDPVSGLLGSVTGTVLDPLLAVGGKSTSGKKLTKAYGSGLLTGAGVTVAVIDSGIALSADFDRRVKAFYDFTTGGTVAARPFDDYGHGTHVAGIIGGSGAHSLLAEQAGLAPGVRFVVLKALDRSGAGYTSDVIRAIDFAVANRRALGIDIINLSLGHPIYEPAATDPLVQAVERASQAGLIVVTSAGNLGTQLETGVPGYAGITSPGNAPSAITVGAIRTEDTVARGDDRLADYSSSGPTWFDGFVKPDVVAAGHNIIAAAAPAGTLYQTYPQVRVGNPYYMRLSGTSMASAVTTGVIALMLEANREAAHTGAPALTPNIVKAVLQFTATDVLSDEGISYDALRQGAGSVNGRGAIDLARAVDTTAAPGSWWLTRTLSPWTTVGGETLLWKQGVIWGDGIIWGNTLDVNQRAWGAGVIWGSTVTWTNGSPSTESLVWTKPETWASGIIWGNTLLTTAEGKGIIWGSTVVADGGSVRWSPLPVTASAAGAQ
jgi:serine protease AprX